MEKFLYSAFSKIPDTPAPNSLYGETLRAIALRRMSRLMTVAAIILGIMFLVSLWNLYSGFIEADTASALSAIAIGFDWSFDAFLDGASQLSGFIPTGALVLSLLNLAALGFVSYLAISLGRMRKLYSMQA